MNKKKAKKPEAKKSEPKVKEAINEQKSEENSKKQLIIAGIAIGIIVVSFVAVLLISRWWHTKDNVTYNGFEFTPVEEYWQTTLTINQKPYVIQFHKLPTEVDLIPSDPNAKKLIFNRPEIVFITTDPDYPSKAVLAGVEMAKILGTSNGIYNLKVKAALTRAVYSQQNASQTIAPVVTCANANQNVTVIHIYIGDKTQIIEDANCIIIEGATSEDTIRSADKFAYELLGIIP